MFECLGVLFDFAEVAIMREGQEDTAPLLRRELPPPDGHRREEGAPGEAGVAQHVLRGVHGLR